MKRKIRIVIALFAASVAGLLTSEVLQFDTLSRVTKVSLEMQAGQDSLVRLAYNNGKPAQIFSDKQSIQSSIYAGPPANVHFYVNNKITPFLQLKITLAGQYKVRDMQVSNLLTNKLLKVDAHELSKLMVGNGKNTVSYTDGWVLLNNTDVKAGYGFNRNFRSENNLLRYGLSLLIALAVFLVAQRYRFNGIPAISDLHSRQLANPHYRIELDGIRGLAAMMVVLEHTWWRFNGAGATGVWLFFALSGYLLSQPFVSKPARAVDFNYIVGYLGRRIMRIVPLYYFVLILMYGVTGRAQQLLNHMLFIEGSGHLWTIPQEMVFYLVLPFLMFALFVVGKFSRVSVVVLLLVATFGLFINPHWIGIELYGLGYNRHPYIAWFLVGVLVAYLPLSKWAGQISVKPTLKTVASFLGLALTVGLVLTSARTVTDYLGLSGTLPVVHPQLFACLGALLIILVLLTPDTLLSSLYSNPMARSVGIMGYSYYLMHPLVISITRELSFAYLNYDLANATLFIVTAVVTWVVCLFTYSYIERPFLAPKSPVVTRS